MEGKAITKKKLYSLLAELETSPGDYITLYMKLPSFPYYINELSPEPKYNICIAEIKEWVNTKAVIQGAKKYKTGAAIFWQEGGNKHIVLPPFPTSENKASFGEFDASLLYRMLDKEYAIGVVLIAWGSYAIGIFHGNDLIESKTGTGHIHKKHKKGGRSQKRFARRTEKQKKDFLTKVANRIDERFKNHISNYISSMRID